jgi:hypothetical protein
MRRYVQSAAIIGTLLIACSGDGVTGEAKARAILNARFDKPDPTDCNAAGANVIVGAFRDPPVPIDDGTASASGAGAYGIACNVSDIGGDKFRVDATIKDGNGVLFAIKGTFPKATDAKGFKADSVTLSNGRTDYAAFTQSDAQCTVLYAGDKQGVTAGRVWGEVTCAAATKDPVIGGTAAGTCVAIAQFRFEDCKKP